MGPQVALQLGLSSIQPQLPSRRCFRGPHAPGGDYARLSKHGRVPSTRRCKVDCCWPPPPQPPGSKPQPITRSIGGLANQVSDEKMRHPRLSGRKAQTTFFIHSRRPVHQSFVSTTLWTVRSVHLLATLRRLRREARRPSQHRRLAEGPATSAMSSLGPPTRSGSTNRHVPIAASHGRTQFLLNYGVRYVQTVQVFADETTSHAPEKQKKRSIEASGGFIDCTNCGRILDGKDGAGSFRVLNKTDHKFRCRNCNEHLNREKVEKPWTTWDCECSSSAVADADADAPLRSGKEERMQELVQSVVLSPRTKVLCCACPGGDCNHTENFCMQLTYNNLVASVQTREISSLSHI